MEKNSVAPDGPFTQKLDLALIVTEPGDTSGEHQVAEVTWDGPPGKILTESDVLEACAKAIQAVRENLPGKEVKFLSREQFITYKLTGSPRVEFVIPGHDKWSLALEDVSELVFESTDFDEEN